MEQKVRRPRAEACCLLEEQQRARGAGPAWPDPRGWTRVAGPAWPDPGEDRWVLGLR